MVNTTRRNILKNSASVGALHPITNLTELDKIFEPVNEIELVEFGITFLDFNPPKHSSHDGVADYLKENNTIYLNPNLPDQARAQFTSNSRIIRSREYHSPRMEISRTQQHTIVLSRGQNLQKAQTTRLHNEYSIPSAQALIRDGTAEILISGDHYEVEPGIKEEIHIDTVNLQYIRELEESEKGARETEIEEQEVTPVVEVQNNGTVEVAVLEE